LYLAIVCVSCIKGPTKLYQYLIHRYQCLVKACQFKYQDLYVETINELLPHKQ